MKSCAYTSDLGRAAIMLAGVCVLAMPSAHIIAQSRPQGALQIVERSIGGEVRYRGDTIWRERDTTMTRTVFRAPLRRRFVAASFTGATHLRPYDAGRSKGRHSQRAHSAKSGGERTRLQRVTRPI